jgi:prefoldin alpha subunit
MDEKEIMAASQELETCKAQLETMAKQEELIQVTLEEYYRTKEALSDLKDKKKGDKILVPIGANCWVHAVLGDMDTAIASIGSNIAVGQSIDDIITRLDDQLEEIETAKVEVSGKVTSLNAKAGELTQMLQAVYAEMQGQQPPQ